MAEADKIAVATGVPSLELMEAAGTAVADEICRRWQPRPVTVLCGPGNNGGDGFVAARLLSEAGWPVKLALSGERDRLRGDAAVNAGRWTGAAEPLDVNVLDGCELVIDALFGAGLARPLSGAALKVVEAVNERSLPCVAVDIPSGVDGNSGQVLGAAVHACLTVTFFRRKPGHLLFPGGGPAGEVVVADIGIPESVLLKIKPLTFANAPLLWLDRYPWPEAASNKYARGHGVVVGGGEMTGAARLASTAARRVGAGLVTIAAPAEAMVVYAAGAPGTLFRPAADDKELAVLLSDPRKNAVLIGPGSGVSETTRLMTLEALRTGRPCVLDADALTVFQDDPQSLFSAIAGPCVLTPHEGEYARLFGCSGDKLFRARAAARQSGATVLIKGADTVIASPDGRAAISVNGPPELATAGTGDVLAGFILGLLAQGMDAFDAACAASWLHGAAAAQFGPGLIAEDIAKTLPTVLRDLKRMP
ncbi:MAG: bifunctional ADP-dependent (S)-NAD(P)H-hydrate dehydratase/NAD(P)H-hydrate epimerase [Rhodospirillales bacterium RIFCSPLOWO2_12_FULL_58_28]|nr:MAG: bifunctional ADP-dependent (S)-NAD(P)H-hydrate dehydratase/NAD(P)H-hydrate epimerase [Rhodospirillales bacterium RIFCSPLOWO2_02_FULL_58_16]OHC79107.1 MAG: bifunctional ADP-dependent (S)-NAD(P)H-hydrate dehydratase/NAD(P)H-hydrate epimerase [Rhodospirillales bacterium RIFCSPLOWO2_12_FULL_58_28]